MFHWWMNWYITEDEVLGINLVDEDYYYLDLVIKQNPKDKEFIPFVIIIFFLYDYKFTLHVT